MNTFFKMNKPNNTKGFNVRAAGVKNKRKVILFDKEVEIHVADTFLKRFAGLMFRKHPIENEGLLITKCNEIHMFFMSFPIDVVFLNKNREVIKCIRGFNPWQVSKKIKGATDTLELPVGTIESYNIKEGDVIGLESENQERFAFIKN